MNYQYKNMIWMYFYTCKLSHIVTVQCNHAICFITGMINPPDKYYFVLGSEDKQGRHI